MTKKEWVKKAIDGEQVERVPMGFWHHFIPHAKMGLIPTHPEVMEEYFELNRQWLKDLDPDFVKIMSDGYLMMPVDIGSGTPMEIADVKAVDLQAFIDGSVKIARGCREIYGQDRLLLMNIFSPFITLVKQIRVCYKDQAYPVLKQMIKEHPEQIKAGVERITDFMIEVVKAVMGGDRADGIYLCTRQCTMDEEAVNLLINPSEIRLLEAANAIDTYNAVHICDFDGKQTNMELYAQYPAKLFNWAVKTEGIQLSEGRKIFGGRTVMGGFDMNKEGVLYTGPREAIQAETERILADAGRQHVILGADCTVDPSINPEHLVWVRECAND